MDFVKIAGKEFARTFNVRAIVQFYYSETVDCTYVETANYKYKFDGNLVPELEKYIKSKGSLLYIERKKKETDDESDI